MTASQQIVPELRHVATIRGEDLGLGEGKLFDVSTDGVIVIVDRFNGELVVTDTTGVRLRSIGRRGEGPAELAGPDDVAFADAHTIVVHDQAAGRLSTFGLDGVWLGATRTAGNGVNLATLDETIYWKTLGSILGTSGYRIERLPLHSDDPSPSETVLQDPDPPDLNATSHVTSGGSFLALGARTFLLQDGRDPILGMVSADERGESRYGVRLDPGREVPMHDAESWHEFSDELRRDIEMRVAARTGTRVNLRKPDYGEPDRMQPFPLWGGIGLDGRGRVWTLPAVPPNQPSELDVFRADGVYLGLTALDTRIRSFRMKGSWLVGYQTDDLGLALYRMYHIEER